MLRNRFHQKERHVTTNKQSSKKRSYYICALPVSNFPLDGRQDQRRIVVLTDKFSGQKEVQFQSVLGFWQRKRPMSLSIKNRGKFT